MESSKIIVNIVPPEKELFHEEQKKNYDGVTVLLLNCAPFKLRKGLASFSLRKPIVAVPCCFEYLKKKLKKCLFSFMNYFILFHLAFCVLEFKNAVTSWNSSFPENPFIITKQLDAFLFWLLLLLLLLYPELFSLQFCDIWNKISVLYRKIHKFYVSHAFTRQSRQITLNKILSLIFTSNGMKVFTTRLIFVSELLVM